MTPKAEALFRFIEQTIDTELASKLAFLANYDKTKKAIREIVDMPDRKIDLFIRFCLHNNGRLSARKRLGHFDFLSDEEITRTPKGTPFIFLYLQELSKVLNEDHAEASPLKRIAPCVRIVVASR